VTANIIAQWADWLAQFWELNVDRWLSAGWVILGILTVIATLGMALQILKSNKELNP
jgi:hypothetical protein